MAASDVYHMGFQSSFSNADGDMGLYKILIHISEGEGDKKILDESFADALYTKNCLKLLGNAFKIII